NANNQDVVTMGTIGARQTAELLRLLSEVQAIAALVLAQAIRFGIGLAALFVAAAFSPRLLALLAPYAYAATVVMLVLVLVVGSEGMGAQRWLVIGPLSIQPSELMKLVLPLTLAAFL
ncbi:MAG: FtsW/RodA/SpoVE family cell cycle protein, partial [Thiohalorhabdaceae bacterium]